MHHIFSLMGYAGLNCGCIFAALRMKRIWDKWKEKWGVETDQRMIWIFIMFAITGSSTVYVRKYLFSVLGIEIESTVWAVVVRILGIYIVYQFLLFIIGTIMGEYKFVSWFLKKMNGRIIPGLKK